MVEKCDTITIYNNTRDANCGQGVLGKSMTKQKTCSFLCVGLLAMGVILLYVPFGVKNLPQMEEWDIIASFDKGIPLLNDFELTIFRPFDDVPYVLASMIAPDSLIGFPILQALLILVKGMSVFGIICILGKKDVFLAMLVSLLTVVFPGDKGLLSIRTINHLMASALFFGCVYLYLTA